MICAMRWIVSGVLVLALGCDRPQEVIDQQACSVLCDCIGDPSPQGQEQCIEVCVSQLGPINEACQACIGDNVERCSLIESECEEPCVGPQPDPDPAAGGDPE
jgi:hypothetical protein